MAQSAGNDTGIGINGLASRGNTGYTGLAAILMQRDAEQQRRQAQSRQAAQLRQARQQQAAEAARAAYIQWQQSTNRANNTAADAARIQQFQTAQQQRHNPQSWNQQVNAPDKPSFAQTIAGYIAPPVMQLKPDPVLPFDVGGSNYPDADRLTAQAREQAVQNRPYNFGTSSQKPIDYSWLYGGYSPMTWEKLIRDGGDDIVSAIAATVDPATIQRRWGALPNERYNYRQNLLNQWINQEAKVLNDKPDIVDDPYYGGYGNYDYGGSGGGYDYEPALQNWWMQMAMWSISPTDYNRG